MKAIKFNLRGKFAHFKKPDVNSYAYFTYSHIHKIAVLGILGGILGLRGYGNSKGDLPEFYEKLKDLKISIIPKKPYFTKRIQSFNNSIGYASYEQGGNLIVREQLLENPSWDILIMENENDEFDELKNRLFNKEFYYLPYLGKNDFPAIIDEVEEITLQKATKAMKCISLVPKDKIEFVKPNREEVFYYEEYLPIRLKEKYLIYEYEKMVLSSWEVEGDKMWECENYGVKFI